ncbi:MAG: hypothetical protein D6678_01185 [Zetaproteobacteria bacterium]|nr:MAG: hypothetical protein D6678_01185 [Zetaproteobacteria bacterium]
MRSFPLLLIALLFTACATNPVSKHSEFVLMSEKDELALGRKAAEEVSKNMPLLPAEDPLTRYVDRVGQTVAAVSDRPNLIYRFRIVDDATINAFALPGGHIYIHRGLLNHMNSEAELAAVLGHEIGHVTARHAVQQYTRMQGYRIGAMVTSIFVPVPYEAMQLSDLLAAAIISGYGREAELQADELSLKYIARAGYDPHATIGILETLKRLDDLEARERSDAGEKVEQYHGAFSSHPETEKRIREAVAKAASLQRTQGRIGHETMLRKLVGYPYGDSPEQGAVVGQRFLHPKLRFQLRFPDGWVIDNRSEALEARLRKQKVFFRLTLRELDKKQTARALLAELIGHRRHTPITSGMQSGFQTAHSTVRTSMPHVSQAAADVHIFLKGDRAYLLAMWEPRKQYPEHRADFAAIAASFRSYDPARDGDVPRIALHRWQAGDSWQALARASGMVLGRFTAEKLAALNGMSVAQHPAPGTLIKIVR